MPSKCVFDKLVKDAVECGDTVMIKVSAKLLDPQRMTRKLPTLGIVHDAATFFEV
jgi:hypothetical protein